MKWINRHPFPLWRFSLGGLRMDSRGSAPCMEVGLDIPDPETRRHWPFVFGETAYVTASDASIYAAPTDDYPFKASTPKVCSRVSGGVHKSRSAASQVEAEVSLGRSPLGMEQGSSGGLAEMAEDPANARGVVRRGDEGEGSAVGPAGQRKHFIDPREKGGPPGGAGEGGGFAFGLRGSGSGRGDMFGLGRKDWAEVSRVGEGIVFPGLGGHEGPQRGMWGENAVAPAAVKG